MPREVFQLGRRNPMNIHHRDAQPEGANNEQGGKPVQQHRGFGVFSHNINLVIISTNEN